MNYRPEIDGLRSIAIILVILFHAEINLFSGGFIGVDIFFVISGYLITTLLYKQLASTNSINLTEFYAKRFLRLYPAIFFLIFVVSITWLALFLGNDERTRIFIKSVTYSLCALANRFFRKNTGGYFDVGSEEQPLLHFWSLAVEEQFYLFWPIILILVAKLSSKERIRSNVIWSLVTISILSFCNSTYFIQTDKIKRAFYQLDSRAWEIALGGLCSFIDIKSLQKKLQHFTTPIISLSLLALGYCVLNYNNRTIFPGPNAVIPTVATALILIFLGQKDTIWNKLFSLNFFVSMGKYSYGWYLWHWPFFSLFKMYNSGRDFSNLEIIILISLSFLMAIISYHYVENKFRYSFIKTRKSQIRVIAITVTILVIVIGLSQTMGIIEKSIGGKEWAHLKEHIHERSTFPVKCDGGSTCSITSKNTKSKVLMIGDSHAHALSMLLSNINRDFKVDTHLITQSGKIPIWGFENGYRHSLNQELVLKHIARDRTSIIMAPRWLRYVGKVMSAREEGRPVSQNKNLEESVQLLKQQLILTIQTLKDHGVNKILIIGPMIEFKEAILNCMNLEKCTISSHESDINRKEIIELLSDVKKGFEGYVRILDLRNLVCDSEFCKPYFFEENTRFPVVYDDDHPSVRFSQKVYHHYRDDMEWLTAINPD